MQKETHCTVEEAAVNLLGTSPDMRFEDLPPEIKNNTANFHEVIFFFEILNVIFHLA